MLNCFGRLLLTSNQPPLILELRFAKEAEQEQLRAINRLLNAEVERLEKERLELKKILRKQAIHRGRVSGRIRSNHEILLPDWLITSHVT